MPNSTLADRIKAIRIAAGDSPADAGKKVGVSRQAFNKWEQGDTENMKLGNLMRFCDRYQVNLEPLLRGDDSQLWNIANSPRKPVLVALDKAVEHESNQTLALSDDQKRLLDGFNAASEETKQAMLVLADIALQRFAGRSETN